MVYPFAFAFRICFLLYEASGHYLSCVALAKLDTLGFYNQMGITVHGCRVWCERLSRIVNSYKC